MSIALKVEVAWVANPYGNLIWTDISQYVTSMATTRGRQYETDQNEAGTCKLELVNTDGRFDPTNTSSPYYPYVLPFRPVRVTAVISGTSYPRFYGYTEKFIQTWPQGGWSNCEIDCVDAFKATLGFAPGDPYDVKVENDYGLSGAAASLPAASWSLFPLDSGPYNDNAQGSTTPLVQWTSGGVTYNDLLSPCRSSTKFAGGVLGDTGASTNTVAPPLTLSQGEMWLNPTSYPPVGMAAAALTSVYPTGTTGTGMVIAGIPGSMYVAAFSDTATDASRGLLMSGLLTTMANLMPTANSAAFGTDVSEWTAGSGATMTRDTTSPLIGSGSMNIYGGTASMNGRVPVTAGHTYQVACAQRRPSGGSTGQPQIGIVWRNSSGGVISTITPTMYSPSGTGWQPLWASPTTAPTGAVSAQLTVTYGGSPGPSVVGFTVVTAGTLAPAGHVAYFPPAAGSQRLYVHSLYAGLWAIPAPSLSAWHHLAWDGDALLVLDGVAQTITSAAFGTSAYPSIRVGGGIVYGATLGSATALFPFAGHIAALYLAKTGITGISPVVLIEAQQHYQYGINGYGQAVTQDFAAAFTGQRVNDVLAAIGWPWGMRDIDAGRSRMCPSGNVVGKAGVGLLQDAADAELGNVFIAATGAVTFRQRDDRNSRTPAVTFGDGTGETPYQVGLTVDFDDTHLANDIAVSQANSSPAFTYEAADFPSQATYGVRGMSVTAQLADQADVQNMAATLLARYKAPLPRLEVLPFELRSNPAIAAAVLGREIGDCVTVKRRPPGAPEIDFGVFVDGIADTVDDGQWTVALQLTPQYPDTTY